MEPNDEFRRRAFGAAGPVFFFFLGLVLLLVVLVVAFVANMPAMLTAAFVVGGLLAVGLAIVWGMRVNRRSVRHGDLTR